MRALLSVPVDCYVEPQGRTRGSGVSKQKGRTSRIKFKLISVQRSPLILPICRASGGVVVKFLEFCLDVGGGELGIMIIKEVIVIFQYI